MTPTDNLREQIYESLSHDEIITVSPNSPVNTFVEDDDFPSKYYIYKVTYDLNQIFPPNKQELFAAILNPSYSSTFKDEALRLWKKIAIGECVEYLHYQLHKAGFEFNVGDKTYATFDILLNDFSVSQIYCMIWKAVADASTLCLEHNFTRKRAANSVIGACERYAERAKMNGWEPAEYNRLKDLPQSVLSSFFFNRVLGISEMGFKVPPTTL